MLVWVIQNNGEADNYEFSIKNSLYEISMMNYNPFLAITSCRY